MMRFRRDDQAASDTTGTLLLVGITVVVMAGVGLAILSIDGPDDETRVDLAMTVDAGTMGWGTGDESIQLLHRGGEPLDRTGINVVVIKNGVATSYTNTGLTGDWADGYLTIGERWTATDNISADDSIMIRVVETTAHGLSLASATLRAGTGIDCTSDLAAPTVASWVQSPTNVNDETVGAVTITATLTDVCSGVDNDVDPHLEYRTDGGVWIDAGAMTRVASARWTDSIPDLGWALEAGNTLEYRLTGMTDNNANSGNSVVQSDLVELVNAYTYPTSGTANTGLLGSFAASQSDSDGDAFSTLSEALGGSLLYPTVSVGSGANSSDNVLGIPDDVWGGVDDNGDNIIVDTFDITGQSGTITSVEIVMESHHRLALSDDDLSIAYYHTSWHTIQTGYSSILDLVDPFEDEELRINITNELPSWTWEDVEDLRLRVKYEKTAVLDNVEFFIDALYLDVETSDTPNSLAVEYDFDPLPAATNGTLQIRHATTNDTFGVEVWDGATWNLRGTSLNGTQWTDWSYQMTSAERTASGGPKIRFVDDTPGGGSRGTLELEYVRVMNS